MIEFIAFVELELLFTFIFKRLIYSRDFVILETLKNICFVDKLFYLI